MATNTEKWKYNEPSDEELLTLDELMAEVTPIIDDDFLKIVINDFDSKVFEYAGILQARIIQ